jgi:Spy/CpxP family protein refolding chaperone
MRIRLGILFFTLLSSFLTAQQGPAPAPAPGPGQKFERGLTIHRSGGPLGAWWKNSKMAEQLHLTDAQVKQLEDAFYQHRLRLIDYGAEMEKADMKLQQMLDSDDSSDAAVNSQVDEVLAARGKMEREFTLMHLNFRKILTPDQWKQLRSMQGDRMHDRIFYRRALPPGGPGPETAPLPPGPQGELLGPAFLPEAGTVGCTTTEKNGMKIVNCTKQIEIITDMENEL